MPLRDTCTKFSSIETFRTGNTITFEIKMEREYTDDCELSYGMKIHSMNLGSDFVLGEIYTFVFNKLTCLYEMP